MGATELEIKINDINIAIFVVFVYVITVIVFDAIPILYMFLFGMVALLCFLVSISYLNTQQQKYGNTHR